MLQHFASLFNYVDGLISLTFNWTLPGSATAEPCSVMTASKMYLWLAFEPINIVCRALTNYLSPLPREPLALLPASSEIAPIQQQSIPSNWRKELQEIAIGYASAGNNPTNPSDDGNSLPASISETSEPKVAIAIPATLGIVCSKDLVAALVTARKAIYNRSCHPILSTVCLQSDGNYLTVTGTDLQTRIEISLPDCGKDVGAVCLPPKLLIDALKKIKGEVSIAVSGESDAGNPIVAIAHANGIIRLEGLSSNDYPLLDAGCCTAKLTVDSKILLTIEQLKPAIACDETKACLNGINFASLGDGMLRLSAADGHKIAQSSLDIGSSLLLDATIPASLFPSKNVGNSLELSFFADYVSLKSGNTCTLTKLCESGFPDLAKLQYDARQNLTVNRKALMTQLQIALAYESKKPKIHLQANPIKQRLELHMNFADVGNMAAWVQTENWVAAPSELSVNPYYLLDILKASKAEIVTLNLTAKYLKSELLAVLSGEVVIAIAALDLSKSSFQPKPVYQVPELDLETFNRALQPVHPSWLEMLGNIGEERQEIAPVLRLCPSPERLLAA